MLNIIHFKYLPYLKKLAIRFNYYDKRVQNDLTRKIKVLQASFQSISYKECNFSFYSLINSISQFTKMNNGYEKTCYTSF